MADKSKRVAEIQAEMAKTVKDVNKLIQSDKREQAKVDKLTKQLQDEMKKQK